MAAQTGFFHSHGTEFCKIGSAAQVNFSGPNLLLRVLVKIPDHFQLFRSSQIDRISGIVRRKFDDVIRKLCPDFVEYVAGDKAGGHGFGYKLSFWQQFEHKGADDVGNISTNGQVKVQRQGQLLVG